MTATSKLHTGLGCEGQRRALAPGTAASAKRTATDAKAVVHGLAPKLKYLKS